LTFGHRFCIINIVAERYERKRNSDDGLAR